MSVAWLAGPGWWIMMRACGSAKRCLARAAKARPRGLAMQIVEMAAYVLHRVVVDARGQEAPGELNEVDVLVGSR